MTWKLQGPSRIMNNDEQLIRYTFELKYVDGKPIKQLITQQHFKGNVQPLSGKDLLLVPEHQRFLEQYYVYVPMPYFNATGEIVKRGDIYFHVQNIEYWGSYQRIRIARVDTGEFSNP